MNVTDSHVELSVIIPVGERQAEVGTLLAEYKAGLDAAGSSYELICVLDGPHEEFARALRELVGAGQRLTIIGLTRSFGEATALMAGFERASGDIVLTLPAYHQVQGSDIPKLLNELEACDLVAARRWPRAGSAFQTLRRNVFHGLLARVTGLQFRDLGCAVRAFNRRVLEEIKLYGDLHRFLAVLAERRGFRVKEVDLRQSPHDRRRGFHTPRMYARSLLDLFTVFFLIRFTKRPLRFFGMVGIGTFVIGAAVLAWLIVERLFMDKAMADRPAMLLASLLVVLGFQLFALGLLGELLIFTHARAIQDYQIERVISFGPRAASSPPPIAPVPAADGSSRP